MRQSWEIMINILCFSVVCSFGDYLQQLMAEQQEEFISNTLLKKIQVLKSEKEQLARNYEQEEEFLTNDLSRKLLQVSQCGLKVDLVLIEKL